MKKRNKRHHELHPIMSYVILIIGVILISGLFSLFDLQSTYYTVSSVTHTFSPVSVTSVSLLSLSGIKYIFANTVSNYATFTVLTHMIIILMGISIMEKSGFLKTAITMLTKKAKKRTVTFVFVFLCILSSIMGEISYMIFIPIGALLFLYGKRNPATGIICSFASLACGSGINFLLTSTDSSLISLTNLASYTINKSYDINRLGFIFIMFVTVIILSILITYITENIITKKVPKFDFDLTIEDDEILITRERKKGMLYAIFASSIYLIIFIYNIIPGLPLSGNLLDNSQTFYIDKLFSPESFFSSGFVFIVTVLFVILGLFYGIGAKTIKNHEDFCKNLSHSLDGIGSMLVMIFFASCLISIFKHSNIGSIIVASFGSIIGNSNFSGIPLILLLFLFSILSSIVLPGSIAKWTILAPSVVPQFMSNGISCEFAQLIFRFGESVSMNITPFLAYFIVYFTFLEKYNQDDKSKVKLSDSIKYQLNFTLPVTFIYLAIIITWYLVGIPLGINTYPTI